MSHQGIPLHLCLPHSHPLPHNFSVFIALILEGLAQSLLLLKASPNLLSELFSPSSVLSSCLAYEIQVLSRLTSMGTGVYNCLLGQVPSVLGAERVIRTGSCLYHLSRVYVQRRGLINRWQEASFFPQLFLGGTEHNHPPSEALHTKLWKQREAFSM